jgi:hypothetical protein
MRVGFVPFFAIDLGVVSLFLLRITFPRLVRLFVGALIITVSGVVLEIPLGLMPIKPRTGQQFLVGTKSVLSFNKL